MFLQNVQKENMISMDKKEQILHYYRVEGLSLREISQRVGLNRKTVTRYVWEYEDVTNQDSEEGIDLYLARLIVLKKLKNI